MKKLVTLLIAMLSMAVAINAQSLKFEIDGVEYESGSTYIKEVRFTDSDMPYKKNGEVFMTLKNTSDATCTYKFKNAGDMISAPEGYERNFQICTDMCYMGDDIPEFTIEANSYLMAYGVTAPASLHINNLDGILGDVEVRYEVSNVDNPDDVYLFNVIYKFIKTTNAPSLKFEIDGVEYESGSTYIKEVRFTDSDMPYKKNGEVFMTLKNTSDATCTYKFKNAGDMISAPEGYERNFLICTTMCVVGDDIPEFTIEGKSTLLGAVPSLHAMNPKGVYGDVEVHYEVANVDNPDDVYLFNVIYKFIKKNAVILNKESVTIEKGETTQLIATIDSGGSDDITITWSSDDESIATVDNEGTVTAISEGTATITATTNDGTNLSASCEVTVTPKTVKSISLDEKAITLERNETAQLTVTVLPEDADNKAVTWSSDDESIATVDDEGTVTAISEGTATITATTNDGTNLSASCEVTVTPKTVKSISLDKEKLNIKIGQSEYLKVTVSPIDADDISVSWRSNNKIIATVDAGGKVTALVPGTAIITVTTNDGTNLSASCEVTVTDPFGINETYTEDINIHTDKGIIILDGLKNGEMFSIQDISGHTVYIGTDNEVYVPENSIYLLQIKDKTYKVFVP